MDPETRMGGLVLKINGECGWAESTNSQLQFHKHFKPIEPIVATEQVVLHSLSIISCACPSTTSYLYKHKHLCSWDVNCPGKLLQVKADHN